MKKLTMMDKGFLIGESREQPMHVGGLNLFTLPEGADQAEFLHTLANNLRDADELFPPFGDRLKSGRLGLAGNTYWEPDPELDLDYHIRHSALPAPGRFRELFTLVSRLHGTLLERSRPLWEMHLIEGLQNRQFAVYSKTHHAAVDGARSVHMSRSMLSPDPHFRMSESPMSLRLWNEYRAARKRNRREVDVSESDMRSVSDLFEMSINSGSHVFRSIRRFAEAWSGRGEGLALPHYNVPRSAINTSIGGARRFVAQSWPFDRIRAVGKAFDGTFNDAVLGMCAGALRLYLQNHAELPDQSLKAMVPVSMRDEGDTDSPNAIIAISADLATHIADPAQRMRAIQYSVREGKAYYEGMSRSETALYFALLQSPSAVMAALGLLPRFPAYNTVISNVPGIREPMYWNGARLDGTYPLSIVTHSVALNITLVTYDKNVDFGIIACRSTVPQTQRMIDYMEQSLQELEVAAGIAAPVRKRKVVARKKVAAKKSAVAKPATKATPATKTKPSAKTTRRKTAAKSATRRKMTPAKAVKPKMIEQ